MARVGAERFLFALAVLGCADRTAAPRDASSPADFSPLDTREQVDGLEVTDVVTTVDGSPAPDANGGDTVEDLAQDATATLTLVKPTGKCYAYELYFPTTLPACSPGATGCMNGDFVVTCQDDGGWYTTDVCGEKAQCSEGKCVALSAPVCKPGERRCVSMGKKCDQVDFVLECKPSGYDWFMHHCSAQGCPVDCQ